MTTLPNPVSFSRTTGEVMFDDGTLSAATHLIDCEGEETEDMDRVVAVVCPAHGKWWTVDLAMLERNTN